jgi:methyl coenzyme M reductase subunit C
MFHHIRTQINLFQTSETQPSEWKPIKASPASLRITNPIRDIVDRMQAANPEKSIISLSIGIPIQIPQSNLKATLLSLEISAIQTQ